MSDRNDPFGDEPSIEILCVPDLRERMLTAVLEAGNGAMDMTQLAGDDPDERHPCGTVCCLAGWAVNCHPQGFDLLYEYRRAGHGTLRAARAILKACNVPEPDFLDMNDVGDHVGDSANARAMNWLLTGVQK